MLAGLRVLDATGRLGWFTGRVLADLGAEVVKLEPPARDIGEPAWRAFNVNKRLLILDVEDEAAREQLRALLAVCDILIETAEPGSAYASLFDPTALADAYPQLIHVSITPFGKYGPRSDWRGTDLEVMAAGGAMSLAGEPNGTPLRISEPQAHAWASAQAAVGALVALAHRRTSGRGQHVDVSAQAAVVTALAHAPTFWDVLGQVIGGSGTFILGRSLTGARFRALWPCRDGYINFILYGGVAGRRTNEQLVAWMRERGVDPEALGGIEWAKFDLKAATQEEVDALERPVMRFFAGITKREFLDGAFAREMLGYPVSTVDDIATDPQLDARGFWQEVPSGESTERHCGAFAIIDGVRPALRYPAGARIGYETLLAEFRAASAGGGAPKRRAA